MKVDLLFKNESWPSSDLENDRQGQIENHQDVASGDRNNFYRGHFLVISLSWVIHPSNFLGHPVC